MFCAVFDLKYRLIFNHLINPKIMSQAEQSQLHNKSAGWSALFSEPMSELVKRYTASVFFDKRLALFDIQGSLAHAQMLCEQQIISAQD